MRKVIKWFLKAIVAGILALAVLSVACIFYYNPGTHLTNADGITDYKWLPNYFAANMTEGNAWNRTDKNGFYNDESAPDKNMDILIMGSSNTEGTHVLYEQNYPYLLSQKTQKSVYNIGISGHSLLTCVKNLDKALEKMQPKEYVIIETGSVTFSEEKINDCLSGEMKALSSYDSGLIFYLQKVPYFKLLYSQLKKWNANDSQAENTDVVSADGVEISTQAYSELTQRISEICKRHGVKPIIFFHSSLTLNGDGTASINAPESAISAFQTACENSGIIFINMGTDFMKMYNESHILPNGFCNTAVNYGHLNKNGVAVIAERLAVTIKGE